MLLPLVTPELVMGVALLLLFLQIFNGWGLGTTAQAIGQVTFAVSYVVVIVRGRLVSIGREYEEAAADLGRAADLAARRASSCRCSPRRSSRARASSSRSRSTTSSSRSTSSAGADTNTVSMLLYSTARGAPTPALNALADDHARDHAGDDHARVPCLQTLRRGERRLRGGDVGGGRN